MTIENLVSDVFFFLGHTPNTDDSAFALRRANMLVRQALQKHTFKSLVRPTLLSVPRGGEVFLEDAAGNELFDLLSASLYVSEFDVKRLKLLTIVEHESELVTYINAGAPEQGYVNTPTWWTCADKRYRFVVNGRKAFIWPYLDQGSAFNSVIVQAVVAPATMVTGAADDVETNSFFLEAGAEWLTQALICDLNVRYGTFVPRQEGMLPPPLQARELAWNELVAYDETRVKHSSDIH